MTFWPGFLSKNIIDGVVVSCKKIVEEQLPETWILDTHGFMKKWVEGKLTKTVLHFLAYLMIFRNLDICSTTTFFALYNNTISHISSTKNIPMLPEI